MNWHIKSKARLREPRADAIVAEVDVTGLPADWRDRVHTLASRYRGALLADRDGALVVAGTFAPEPATLRAAESLVKALLDGGLGARAAGWACWTIVYFALGLVQEDPRTGPGGTGPARPHGPHGTDRPVGRRPPLPAQRAAVPDGRGTSPRGSTSGSASS